MNPIQTTPPQDPDVDEAAGHDDPLDNLLTQIINGFFVLTDGQGAVSKWGEPAELLFGLDASEVLGKSLFDTLVDHAPPEAQAWQRFLESGEAPRTAASQPVSAIYAVDKRSFPLEMVFIPVKLDEGFDFSLFLEDLSFELPRNLMLMRMRQQHPVVVRALRQSLETEPQPWDGWRTAGTLVAFRPTQPTPWVEDALAAREAARAAEDIEGEERLDPDPGIQGDSIADLDDAAAVVARLLSALERIEDLEKTAADLPVALEEARREAQASRDRAEQAEQKVNEAREQLERVREEMPAAEDPAERRELLERISRLEATLAEATSAQDEELLERITQLEATLAEAAQDEVLLERIGQLEAGLAEATSSTQGEELLERIRGLEAGLAEASSSAEGAELLERISDLEARLAQASTSAQAELLERITGLETNASSADQELMERIHGLEASLAEASSSADTELLERISGLEASLAEATASTQGEELLERISGLEASLAEAPA
jgi:hypothetical protein